MISGFICRKEQLKKSSHVCLSPRWKIYASRRYPKKHVAIRQYARRHLHQMPAPKDCRHWRWLKQRLPQAQSWTVYSHILFFDLQILTNQSIFHPLLNRFSILYQLLVLSLLCPFLISGGRRTLILMHKS